MAEVSIAIIVSSFKLERLSIVPDLSILELSYIVKIINISECLEWYIHNITIYNSYISIYKTYFVVCSIL